MEASAVELWGPQLKQLVPARVVDS